MGNHKLSYPFYIAVLWIIFMCIVNPIGDFPLNDDWAYARDVKVLAEENRLIFDDWGAMTLVVHTLWGGLFSKIFGFSFTVLRFSTLVLGLAGLLGCYFLFKESGKEDRIAFWGTILVAFNPFYFCLSYSYMTEIPFLCLLLWSAYFFTKNLNGKATYNIAIATLFAILATLIRQPGVLLPFAFLFVFLLKNKWSFKNLVLSILPFLATYGSLTLFVKWREATYGLSHNFGTTDKIINNLLTGDFINNLDYYGKAFFMYWGLFSLPLILIMIPFFWKKTTTIQKIISIVITLLISYPQFHIYYATVLGNVFHNFGMGPISIPTTSETHPMRIGQTDWYNILFVGFVSGVFLLKWIIIRIIQSILFLKNKTSETISWGTVFALIISLGYFTFLMLGTHFIDRYTLTVFPFLILLITPNQLTFKIPILFKSLAAIGLLVLMIFSTGATHDLLSWNRGRWKTIDYALNEMHLNSNQLDGGFEYNNWKKSTSRKHTEQNNLEWWTDKEEKHILSFSPSCGYDVVKTFPFPRYFPPRTDSIYLLKNLPARQLSSILCDAETITSDSLYFIANDSTTLLQNQKNHTTDKSHSRQYAIKVNAENEYGLNLKLKEIKPCEKIWIEAYRFPAKHNSGSLILAAADPKILYKVQNSGTNEIDTKGWEKVSMQVSLPIDFQTTELNFFVYNPSKEEVWFDDLKITRVKF